MKIKVCVITGSRAEYGLLYPLIKELKSLSLFDLKILVTGMHLSKKFGFTYKEIEADGFEIEEKIPILSSGDSAEDVAKAIGRGCAGFAKAFKKINPGMVIVLGDRFETFAAAIAAFIANIPLVHLYGGELTEGLIDDAIRHSITKMSCFHFVSTETYRKRVIQLGEDPKNVFTVGALGLDNIKTLKFFPKSELEKVLHFKLNKKTVLVTFNPLTLEKKSSESQCRQLLAALNALKDIRVIFTRANADTEGRAIINLVEQFVKEHPDRAVSFISLGRIKYLSLMRCVDAVLGNSSSGIIETASFKKPTVNIGDRQRGRVRGANVIDCLPLKREIMSSLSQAFSDSFVQHCKQVTNLYGDGKAAKRIVRILKAKFKQKINLKKHFFDIDFKL